MSFTITDDNYEHYNQVFLIIYKHLFPATNMPLPAETQPAAVLDSWAKKNKSLAKKGLKAGLMDIASQIKEFPAPLLKAINDDLALAGLPDMASLKATFSNLIEKVIKRGKIRNEEEYYAVKEIVIDQASEYSDTVRSELEKLMMEFEFKIRKKKRS